MVQASLGQMGQASPIAGLSLGSCIMSNSVVSLTWLSIVCMVQAYLEQMGQASPIAGLSLGSCILGNSMVSADLAQHCLYGAGIIGANGAGKSTLFRMLMGQEQPDSGSLKIGETVKTMYVDQSRESLASERYGVFAVLLFQHAHRPHVQLIVGV